MAEMKQQELFMLWIFCRAPGAAALMCVVSVLLAHLVGSWLLQFYQIASFSCSESWEEWIHHFLASGTKFSLRSPMSLRLEAVRDRYRFHFICIDCSLSSWAPVWILIDTLNKKLLHYSECQYTQLKDYPTLHYSKTGQWDVSRYNWRGLLGR